MSHRRYRSKRLHFSPAATLLSPDTFARMLGESIHAYRERDGRSLEELASLVGITAAEWEAIEAGKVPEFFDVIERIYHAMDAGLTIGELDYLKHLFGPSCPDRYPSE
jgi:transcriptional regulator with XRE-family HTH domain